MIRNTGQSWVLRHLARLLSCKSFREDTFVYHQIQGRFHGLTHRAKGAPPRLDYLLMPFGMLALMANNLVHRKLQRAHTSVLGTSRAVR